MSEEKLNGKEITEQIVQAGLNAIPYVGSPLASLYFGIKNEKRFKRLETFYSELAEEIKRTQSDLNNMQAAKPDEGTAAIIEDINTQIENEPTEQKRRLYKTFFKSNIYNPLLLSYEERKILLDALNKLSVLDISMIQFLNSQQKPVPVRNIQRGNASNYEILGGINRLKYYGFCATYTLSMVVGSDADNALNESVAITDYGKKFIQYIE